MQVAEHDQTRSRLIDAAGQVFSEKGFAGATVREICARADANVAAVNYHFRDKVGLYVEVMKESMAQAAEEDRRLVADTESTPHGIVTALITAMLQRISTPGVRSAWHVRIMAHELVKPSPALDRVVQEVMTPRYDMLRGVIARIIGLPPDHDTTRLCAHSIIGQVIHYAHAKPVIGRLWPSLQFSPERVQEIAEHIARFSLAGMARSASTQEQELHA